MLRQSSPLTYSQLNKTSTRFVVLLTVTCTLTENITVWTVLLHVMLLIVLSTNNS